MDDAELQRELLKAHDKQDYARLADLYTKAANQLEASHDIDAACFYWTHALVFALDAGIDEATAILSQKLTTYGRL